MDLESYIHQAIFEENEKHIQLYEMIWSNFEEDGFVITDEPGNEVDCIFKAVAIQNLIGEFIYRVYDEVNETGYEDIIRYLGNLGIGEESAVAYCESNPNIDTDDDDNELKLKNGLDYITEIVADKILELFSATDLFDYFFAATYDFEQDFTFAFEDVDEFMAFVDSNTERLDAYKDEYPSVLSWIESGMIV